jgi:hypothetical protein
MKRKYTKDFIVDIVKHYDKRATKLTDKKIDEIIDQAYAELATLVQAFSDEEVVSVKDYLENGETKFTIDVLEDVSSIYDIYATIENPDSGFPHGIQKIRDSEIVYLDNRYNGRVHVDLSKKLLDIDNIVIKYYYVPTAETEEVYMDAQVMLALRNAIGITLYDYIKDIESSSQKRAATERTARAIIPSAPEDSNDPSFGHIFHHIEY